jgi:hypothetical protein
MPVKYSSSRLRESIAENPLNTKYLKNMEQNTIHGLMKIGPSEFMERLYKNGEIYMKEFLWFKDLEDDKQRSDKNEGLYMLKQAPYLKIRTEDGKEFEFSTSGKGIKLTSPAKFRGHYTDIKANVYCMYGFDSKICSKSNVVDSQILEFGDSAVLVFNPSEFLNRIKNSLSALGLKPICRMVKYYDEETYEGEDMLAFHKPNFFEHQNEFRIFVEREEYGDLKFNIGSLEDIAEIHSTDTILNSMRFEITPDTKQFRFCFQISG